MIYNNCKNIYIVNIKMNSRLIVKNIPKNISE